MTTQTMNIITIFSILIAIGSTYPVFLYFKEKKKPKIILMIIGLLLIIIANVLFWGSLMLYSNTNKENIYNKNIDIVIDDKQHPKEQSKEHKKEEPKQHSNNKDNKEHNNIENKNKNIINNKQHSDNNDIKLQSDNNEKKEFNINDNNAEEETYLKNGKLKF